MVKRIKKRVPKKESEEIAQDGIESEGEATLAGESDRDQQDSESFRAEIAANAQGASADAFSDLMEGFLLKLADNWLFVLLLIGVGLGLYGFVQYSDQAAQERLADGRAALLKSFDAYKDLEHAEVRALKQNTKSSGDNLLGLSTSPASEITSPDAASYTSFADQVKALKLPAKSAPLRDLTEASARFDAAQTAGEFKAAADLFKKVAKNPSVEPIAQSLALRNTAIALEEAASLDNKAENWAAAAQAWADFGAADQTIFGLNAAVNRARVLRSSGDFAAAHKAYQEIKQAHSAALQDPANRELNKLVKLGLALSASKSAAKEDAK